VAAGANEADVVDKPGKAKVNDANRVDEADTPKVDKADDADKANATNKAIATNEAEVNKAIEAIVANEAEATKATNANDTTKANDADKADKVDKANEADESNEAKEAIEANEAICGSEMIATAMKPKNPVDETVDPANMTNKLDELAVAKGGAEGHVVAKGHVVSVDCVDDGFLYSLTKYSAIFAEVKGYYGIFVLNNQLVGMVWSCSRSLKCQLCRGLILKKGNCCRPPRESSSALFFPSKCDATINLDDPSGKVHAPSQFRINFESTTSWKSLLE
jgi:hypothetical protein